MITKLKIKQIIYNEFSFTPAERAAFILYALGIRETDINNINMSAVKKAAVMNCLRDIEIKNMAGITLESFSCGNSEHRKTACHYNSGSNSAVECSPTRTEVAGSNPVSRSILDQSSNPDASSG